LAPYTTTNGFAQMDLIPLLHQGLSKAGAILSRCQLQGRSNLHPPGQVRDTCQVTVSQNLQEKGPVRWYDGIVEPLDRPMWPHMAHLPGETLLPASQ